MSLNLSSNNKYVNSPQYTIFLILKTNKMKCIHPMDEDGPPMDHKTNKKKLEMAKEKNDSKKRFSTNCCRYEGNELFQIV